MQYLCYNLQCLLQVYFCKFVFINFFFIIDLCHETGSRLPLAPTGSNSSPRQSVVLPMVGGLVLQPARVAIPKLDLTWRRRLQERLEGEKFIFLLILNQFICVFLKKREVDSVQVCV